MDRQAPPSLSAMAFESMQTRHECSCFAVTQVCAAGRDRRHCHLFRCPPSPTFKLSVSRPRSAEPLQNLCCEAQVSSRGTAYYKQCRRIMPTLLPAAELLMRGVMDLRHKHWQGGFHVMEQGGRNAEMAVEEARCTATCHLACMRRS